MAKKDEKTKDSQDGEDEKIEPVDLEHERNLKVTAMMEAETRRSPEERSPEDVGELRVDPVDVDHEHSLIQEAMQAPLVVLEGTTHDGLEGPTHRVGEVWESMAPEDDDVGGGRRRVRVQALEDGEVTAVNLVTGTTSHIKAENLTPPKWRRAHS